MGSVITIPTKPFIKRWKHKLFSCPTFWKSFIDKNSSYKCPRCWKKLRCYWDGNDITGHGTDICHKCQKEIERKELK